MIAIFDIVTAPQQIKRYPKKITNTPMLKGASNNTRHEPYYSTNDMHRTCPSYSQENDDMKLIRAKFAKFHCLHPNVINYIDSQEGSLPAPIVWSRTSTKQDNSPLSVAHAQNLQCSSANKQHVPVVEVDEWSKDFISLVESDH